MREGERREALGREPSAQVAERTAFALTAAPELTGPIGTFSLLASKPELCSERQVAEACHAVFQWGETRSLSRVAVLFSEAAAYIDDDPRWALAAARSCRATGDYDRSARWYIRGFGLARSAKRTSDAVRSLLGFGGLLRTVGRLHEALPYFESAARRADRRNRRKLAAETHHDLLLLLTELGQYEEARYHAEGAVRYYSGRHRRLPYLVHDAAFLFIRLHLYTPALSLCEGIPALVPRPNDAALVWSTVAWAAAGAGKPDQYKYAERQTLQMLGLTDEHAPATLIHLAEGARALGEWDVAKRYAEASATAAAERKDAAIAREAAELIIALDAEEAAPPEEHASPEMQALLRELSIRVRIALRRAAK
jgi:tetratricopeptide (TPR) repeat protein